MMIMRWCNVQTNEHDLQTKTYPIIYTNHKLHNNLRVLSHIETVPVECNGLYREAPLII